MLDSFSTWKHQKTLWLYLFRGYTNAKLGRNGLWRPHNNVFWSIANWQNGSWPKRSKIFSLHIFYENVRINGLVKWPTTQWLYACSTSTKKILKQCLLALIRCLICRLWTDIYSQGENQSALCKGTFRNCQTSKMDCFAEIVNSLTIFEKFSVLDVW